jgi:hypothetical protein
MQPVHDVAAPAKTGWPQRLFGRWWRRQSPARQDRYATLGPLVSVLLFLAAIITAFWYLRNEELEREQASVKRDTEIAQQQIRLRLIENQEQLVRIAREIGTRTIDQEEFLGQAASFTRERPEITSLVWRRQPGAACELFGDHLPGRDRSACRTRRHAAPRRARERLRRRARTAPAGVLAAVQRPQRQCGVPDPRAADRPRAFAGSLMAEYSVEACCATSCRRRCPPPRHRLLDANDRVLASTVRQPGVASRARADRPRACRLRRPATACSCAARATAPRWA